MIHHTLPFCSVRVHLQASYTFARIIISYRFRSWYTLENGKELWNGLIMWLWPQFCWTTCSSVENGLNIYLSKYLSIYLSIYLSFYLSNYLSQKNCLYLEAASLWDPSRALHEGVWGGGRNRPLPHTRLIDKIDSRFSEEKIISAS